MDKFLDTWEAKDSDEGEKEAQEAHTAAVEAEKAEEATESVGAVTATETESNIGTTIIHESSDGDTSDYDIDMGSDTLAEKLRLDAEEETEEDEEAWYTKLLGNKALMDILASAGLSALKAYRSNKKDKDKKTVKKSGGGGGGSAAKVPTEALGGIMGSARRT